MKIVSNRNIVLIKNVDIHIVSMNIKISNKILKTGYKGFMDVKQLK